MDELNKEEMNRQGQEPDNNQAADNNLNQGSYQAQDNHSSQGYSYQYSNSNYSGNSATDHPYPVYPTPQYVPPVKKKGKRRGFFKFAKFTAAALAFGLFAGAATSGYNYIVDHSNPAAVQEETKTDPITVTPSAQSGNDSGTIIPTNNNPEGIVSDVSDVVSKVMPSIVAINSSSTVTNYDFFSGRQFNEPVQGSGSGIIIGQNDNSILILTNNHVVNGAQQVEVVFSDESTAKATIRGAEATPDLAVLEVKMKDLSEDTLKSIRVATLGDSTKLKAGEMAIAIGNALGYGQSVTVGYISAVNREVDIDGNKMTLLQTDAAINPGNSGGALINAAGEVIGINSLKFASAEVEGMGYAIPISNAVPIVNQLMNREVLGESEKGFLGINLDTAQEVTDQFSQQFNMPVGIYINDIIKDSPADKAGLKTGNIISGVNGIKVAKVEDLINTISYYKVGSKVTLQLNVLENGSYVQKDLEVILGKRPANQ